MATLLVLTNINYILSSKLTKGGIFLYYSKKPLVPVEEVETSVWACSKESCTCWMREGLSLEKTPTCPICSSTMEKTIKTIPPLSNPSNRR